MRTMTTRATEVGAWQGGPATSPQKVRWGAVYAGTVLGLALLALLSTLWFALAYSSGVREVRVNLEWYVGISAIVCLFLGGLLSGWLSGVRGAGAGFFNGMTIWAMILVLTLAVGVPAIMSVFNLGRVIQPTDGTGATGIMGVDSAFWATFWAILGGLLASAIGGAIGGALTTPANANVKVASPLAVERDTEIDDDLVDRDDSEVTRAS
jgi:hypothetical protein